MITLQDLEKMGRSGKGIIEVWDGTESRRTEFEYLRTEIQPGDSHVLPEKPLTYVFLDRGSSDYVRLHFENGILYKGGRLSPEVQENAEVVLEKVSASGS
mgnify:CR=1 FL=1